MNRRLAAALTSCLSTAFLPMGLSEAASLRVAPVIVDIAKGATSTIAIQNMGNAPANVQVRIFRWVQQGGRNKLVQTRDVVASPPFTKIRPNARNVIRIVRLSKRPIVGEESYRVIIDEVPRRTKSNTTKIGIALRYSLPVFFGANTISDKRLKWSVTQKNGHTIVTAKNTGRRRVRLSAMTLSDKSSGRGTMRFSKGLAGYVLGGSTVTWKRKGLISRTRKSGRVLISARTENGKIQSEAKLRTAQ